GGREPDRHEPPSVRMDRRAGAGVLMKRPAEMFLLNDGNRPARSQRRSRPVGPDLPLGEIIARNDMQRFLKRRVISGGIEDDAVPVDQKEDMGEAGPRRGDPAEMEGGDLDQLPIR